MPTNDFLPFAVGDGANVVSQTEYLEMETERNNGFAAGIAKGSQLNKVWRQSSAMSAALAQFIIDATDSDLLDDGDIAAIAEKLQQAIAACLASADLGFLVAADNLSDLADPAAARNNLGLGTASGGGGAGVADRHDPRQAFGHGRLRLG